MSKHIMHSRPPIAITEQPNKITIVDKTFDQKIAYLLEGSGLNRAKQIFIHSLP